jgi:eukaryotic-like serine/threonine-protein kinase
MDRKKIGRYEIVDELGRGAMGAVYRAHDPVMGRTVALKCILSAALSGDQTSEYRQRFTREARAAGALAHPGIVPVFDAGEDDGVPFLVMEFVQGQTLADSMKQGTRYSIDQVCEIGQHIADALGYLHRNGIVHRDIKPANILMTSREVYGAERPRITDFGVAKLAGGEVTTTGQLLGTPAFMPPEQFTGAPIDGRTDLFSLGVILYRMACGEQPFAGETLTAVSYKIVHTDPIPPSKLNPGVSQAVEGVLLKCLAKNPADRFQTGEELAAALSAVRYTGKTATSSAHPAHATMNYRPDETVDVAPAPPRAAFATHAAPPPPYVPQPPSQATYTAAAPAAPRSFSPAAGPAAPQYPATPQYPAAQPPAPPRPLTPPSQAAPAPMRMPAAPLPPGNGSVPALSPSSQAAPPRPATPAAAPAKATVHTVATSPSMKTTGIGRISAKAEEPPKKRGSMTILIWIVIAVAAVFVIRYVLQDRVQQSLEDAGTGTTHPTAQTPSAGPTLGASTATAEYNPHGLDPSRSGHLRLELNGVPSTVPVSLDVDGAPYWSGTPDSQGNYSGFLIPAGRHQLRITATSGAGIVSSNSVSADLTPGKRLILSTQVHPQPTSGAGGLDRSAHISLTVRADAMTF